MSLRTEINLDVAPAAPGEFAALDLGPRIHLEIPVVLAPMAGVTNAPFRVLCRRFGQALFVSEMITARGLVEGNKKTRLLAGHDPEEEIRSSQLYGTDPRHVEEACRMLIDDFGVEHVDLNLGCPVRKVTVKGGGAAIPYRLGLLRSLLEALVRASADRVPITIKMRLGIDDDHLTYREAGRLAQEVGITAVGLHARTAAQYYDGHARWEHIGELQSLLSIPVLGNGDIWESWDALRMMRATGCRGVIIGRGCLGRPWLFGELQSLFRGEEPAVPPRFGQVRTILLEHAELLRDYFGARGGILHTRKYATWYTKSFRGAAEIRSRLSRIDSIEEMDALLQELPQDLEFPMTGLRVRRCKAGGTQKVALPDGYLQNPEATALPSEDLFAEGG